MRAISVLLTAVTVMCAAPRIFAADSSDRVPPAVVVELEDGSSLHGQCQTGVLRLRSAVLGAIELPMREIKRIEMTEQEGEVRVRLMSGEIVTGKPELKQIEIESLIGSLTIPMKSIAGIVCSHPSGLIASYNFNGTADDSSGNGLHGSVRGATLCPDRNGTKDSAYSFDGVDDYIQFGNLPDSKELTICAWVNAENDVPWMSDGDWASGNDLMLGCGPNSLIARLDKAGSTFTESVETKTKIQNHWRHVCWTITPRRSNFYVDAVLRGTLSKGASNIGNHNFMIGTMEFPQGKKGWMGYWKGKISSLSIYSRVLTEKEIKENFEQAD